MRTRKHPKDRKDEIFAVATELAEQIGITRVTRECVASRAGVSKSLVSHYFGTMQDLKEALIQQAFKDKNNKIIQNSRYKFKD